MVDDFLFNIFPHSKMHCCMHLTKVIFNLDHLAVMFVQ